MKPRRHGRIFGIGILLLLSWTGIGLAQQTPEASPEAEFAWVEIPEDATVKPLIEQQVRRQIEEQKLISFEQTTAVFDRWVRDKQRVLEEWQRRFDESREALRRSFQAISDELTHYVSLSNKLEVAEISLRAALNRIQTLDERIRSLKNERKTIEQNFQAQLNDFGWQILLKGTLEQEFIESISQDEMKQLVGNAINTQAIRLINEGMVQSSGEIRDHEILQNRIRSVTAGRAETTSTYPIGISSDVLNEQGIPQGTIDHLFHIVTVFPFNSGETGRGTTDLGGAADAVTGTTLEAQTEEVRESTLDELLSGSDIQDPNIKGFLSNWQRIIQKNNRNTFAKLDAIRQTTEANLREIDGRISIFDEERRGKRCEAVRTQLSISGTIDQAHQEWRQQCPTDDAIDNLIQQQKHWEEQIWPRLAADFQQKQSEYARNYGTKIIAFDRVVDGKRKGDETPIDTWARVAQEAFADLDKEVSIQQYREEILIIDQKLSKYDSQTVEYKPVPKAFAIIYLATHGFSGQFVSIAGVGVKYQLQSQTQVATVRPKRPRLKSATQCDLHRIQRMLSAKIPLEAVSKRCLIPIHQEALEE